MCVLSQHIADLKTREPCPLYPVEKSNLTKNVGNLSLEGVRKERNNWRGGVEKGARGCSPISPEKKIEKRIDPARISMIK